MQAKDIFREKRDVLKTKIEKHEDITQKYGNLQSHASQQQQTDCKEQNVYPETEEPTKQRPHQSAEAGTTRGSNIKMAAEDVTRTRSNAPLLTQIREDPSPQICPDQRLRAQNNHT